jgi:AraC family transcriptional regulator
MDANRPALFETNLVLRATGRHHQVRDFPGPLSIKSVAQGVVRWKLGRREIQVDECSFLTLAEGEPYSMDIDTPRPVTTCCVFFQRGFVESVYGSVTNPAEIEEIARPMEPASTIHPADDRILPRMRAISEAGDCHPLWKDQQFLLLARDLLLLGAESRKQLSRLPGARPATRAEALRRLTRGREFMHANLDQPLNLATIAAAACVSTYHFHRLFTRAFGESPHDYITRIRLDRARRLLALGARTIPEICLEVGFQSAASFSGLFRRKFGVAPSSLRNSKNR